MPVPPPTSSGDLPLGVHRASLRELLDRFGVGSRQRLFDHAAADAHFGASVFWVRRLAAMGGEQATIEYWQVKRGGGQRGIVEIIGEMP